MDGDIGSCIVASNFLGRGGKGCSESCLRQNIELEADAEAFRDLLEREYSCVQNRKLDGDRVQAT